MSTDEMEAGPERAPKIQEQDASAQESAAQSPGPNGGGSLDFVIDVPLQVTVEIGSASMLVKDVLQLGRGSVIPLDRMSGDPADILVNGRLIAKGEVTLVDDRLAVRVTQVMGANAGDDAR